MVDAIRSAATEIVAGKTDQGNLKLRREIRLCALFAGPRLLFAMVKLKASAQISGLAVPSSSISPLSGADLSDGALHARSRLLSFDEGLAGHRPRNPSSGNDRTGGGQQVPGISGLSPAVLGGLPIL